MNELMLERVARYQYTNASKRVVEKYNGIVVFWEQLSLEDRIPWLEDAKCAIEALYEPTEAMLEILRENGGIVGYQMMLDCVLKGTDMTEVIQFVSKEKLETERMIKEARAMYESIFPTDNGEQNENDQRRSYEQNERSLP